MSFLHFLEKQLIDVIEWSEPANGILAHHFPTQDAEIQTGGLLTVRESEMAAFVNEGRIADIFGPGLYTLTTQNLPLLTDLLNWDKGFVSAFKSDVYFFSTRLQIDQKWGTATPITIRDKEFGAVRVRAYGVYTYHLADPRAFFTQISGTRSDFYAGDLEGELRETIVSILTDVFATSGLSFLDMTANKAALAGTVATQLQPAFASLGLQLAQFAVENISLPDELQKSLDGRIGMSMVGDLDRYTQFAAAQAMSVAAANPGGAAGLGMGLGMGAAFAQSMSTSPRPAASPAAIASPAAAGTKFCSTCGHTVAQNAKFCADCGSAQ